MMKNDSSPDMVIICGPTGIGKTTVSIEIAKRFNGEIISADSMQIYRQMNIGTAKPTPEQRTEVPHHLIDIADPDESFDAAKYARMAHETIAQLYAKSVLPFVVGGTGLYIKALLYGLFESESPDPALRQHLKEIATSKGSLVLHDRLRQRDPLKAAQLHPHDTYRIIRAIEIVETTGKSISEYQQRHRFSERRYRALKIGLYAERPVLYDRIDRRVDMMIASGLKTEVEKLIDMGYSPALKSMQSIGYRHIIEYLEGKLSWDETVRTLKRDTRRYAKRQMTWFRSDPEIIWIPFAQSENIYLHIINFLSANAEK